MSSIREQRERALPADMTPAERADALALLEAEDARWNALTADERADLGGLAIGLPAHFPDELDLNPYLAPRDRMRALQERNERYAAELRAVQARLWNSIAETVDYAAEQSQLFLTSGLPAPSGSDQLALAMRSVALDTSARLAIPEAEVHEIAANTRRLQTRLPETWDAFAGGRVDERNARRAAYIAASIPVGVGDPAAEAAADERLDRNLAVWATQLTPGKFRKRAQQLREQLHPESIQQRYDRANTGRRFWIEPMHDGMCELGLITDAVSASKINARLEGMTRQLAAVPDETRTFAQIRHDLARDLLLDGVVTPAEQTDDQPGRTGTPQVRVQLMLTIPALTLLGRTDRPPTLDGIGPIPLSLATELAGEAASFRRVLTDPLDGSILDAEAHSRRLTADLDWWIRYLNKTCRAPGCMRAAESCDIDHTIPWADDGPTSPTNLGPLSPGHHTVKHEGAWQCRQIAPGVFEWTSPTGHRTRVYPDDCLLRSADR